MDASAIVCMLDDCACPVLPYRRTLVGSACVADDGTTMRHIERRYFCGSRRYVIKPHARGGGADVRAELKEEVADVT